MQATESASSTAKKCSAKASTGARISPRADVFETETSFGIVLDIPGITQEEVEIRLENQILTVETSSDSPQSPRFHRGFRVSSAIDSGQIQASLNNGVLEVVLPKRSESLRKIISLTPH